FKIDKDKHGKLLGYKQLYQANTVTFKPDEIIYFQFNPNTYSIYGQPIIESIIDEVATLLFTNEYIASYFTEDSIPPGILNLGPIGPEAYKAAKQEFMMYRGRLSKQFIRVVRGSNNIQWIWLRRANAESQLDELRKSVERIIFRNFGIQPIEYGSSEVNRSTALIQFKISKAKMLYPLINAINDCFTRGLLEDAGYKDLRFVIKKPLYDDEAEVSRADQRYVWNGIMSINEVRKKRGMTPSDIPGGDKHIIKVGSQIIYVEDLDDPEKVREILASSNTPRGKGNNPPPGLLLNR
ncbi:phage portal protein, partial [Candidatus Aerophobetes bacterium]|nr:phage portal protein [Candidatus Aerophobetes bacterium]